MREIKFRARHTKNKQWYYGIEQNYEDDPLLPLGIFWLWVEQGILDRKTLGQYTGLKDTNGKAIKEIYEGDILSSHSGLALPVSVDEAHSYRFMWGKDLLCKADSIYGEVIGNIYENPELLPS